MRRGLPRILFVNTNGTGMGHLSRCLAYARRMRGRAIPVFFSMASAVEVIHSMGFEADYFVSEGWSRSHVNAWNRELAVRIGLMLEEVRPDVVVFDGTWPFHGLMEACHAYEIPFRVWSNRGLYKASVERVPVRESAFDLVIVPGEIGAQFSVERAQRPGRKVTTQPVTLLRREEVLTREGARSALGLERHGRYALLSLGNFTDFHGIAAGLVAEIRKHGYTVLSARPPICVSDMPLADAMSISVYPVARFLRAFDVFVGSAGYNTCCEVIQAAVPTLLIPNPTAADDQAKRAEMASRYAPIVISRYESAEERENVVSRLLELRSEPAERPTIDLDGAELAADEIVALVEQKAAA